MTELKYKLIDELGNPFFCDPDVYPVARAISPQEFEQRVEAIQQNSEEFQAILLHNALAGKTTLTQDQKQIVYSEHKKLNSISLTPAGDGYRFSLRVAQNKASGFAIDGSIDFSGSVSITKKQATVITCPICLAGGTLIDTPDGPVEVEDLRVGMPVWTADRAGVRQPAIVMQTSQRAIAEGTLLIRLVLEDGRMLVVSEGHPAADGRAIGTYRVGQTLDGSRITEMELIPYAGTVTYDLLPSGETSLYWANGILLGSTLSLPEP